MGSDPRVLVTGAGGQVGTRAARPPARTRSSSTAPASTCATREAVRAAFGPGDVVIHAAAMTDVDGCERDPERRVRRERRRRRQRGRDRRARDPALDRLRLRRRGRAARTPRTTRPGRSPPTGAPSSRPSGPCSAAAGNLVVRTSWVYGDGRNFIRSILAAERGREARCGSSTTSAAGPTWAGDLAARARAPRRGRATTGIVHVTGDGEPCTWADLAELVVGHPVAADLVGGVRGARAAAALERARPRPGARARRASGRLAPVGSTLPGGRAVKGVVLAGGLGTRLGADDDGREQARARPVRRADDPLPDPQRWPGRG